MGLAVGQFARLSLERVQSVGSVCTCNEETHALLPVNTFR